MLISREPLPAPEYTIPPVKWIDPDPECSCCPCHGPHITPAPTWVDNLATAMLVSCPFILLGVGFWGWAAGVI